MQYLHLMSQRGHVDPMLNLLLPGFCVLAGIAIVDAGCDPQAVPAVQSASGQIQQPTPPGSMVRPNRPVNAVVRPRCGPTGGPAVELYLADSVVNAVPPQFPHIRIVIWRSPADLVDQTFRWPTSDLTGYAQRCPWPDPCEPVSKGHVAFATVDPDGFVEGELDLQFDDGDRVQRAFLATWQPRILPCR